MTKLFSWFRHIFANFGEEYTYTDCQQLVERSRQGDQVATATISMVRKNAETGNAKAVRSLEEIKRYARSTSPMNSTIGHDAHILKQTCFEGDVEKIGPQLTKVALSNPNAAIVSLANSCNVRELAQKIDECIKSEAFKQGFAKPVLLLKLMKKVDHDTQHALLLGYVLGLATRLQMVRNPSCPIAVYSRTAAWEVGQ